MRNRRAFFTFFFLITSCVLAGSVSAQIQFSIPKNLRPVQFNQKFDISSWNHYNSVEGLFAGVDGTLVPFPQKRLAFSGGAGYGFASKTPRFHFYTIASFGNQNAVQLGAGFFNHTAANEKWLIGEIENSFAAILLHEEFMDYYGLKGWQGWAQFRLKNWITLRGLFQSADYKSCRKETDWSLYPNKRRKFRPNPAVRSGKENLFRMSLIVDRLDNPIYPMAGFYLQVAAEKALPSSEAQFQDYSGFFSTFRWFQPAAGNQKISVRVRGAAVFHADFLPQHLIDFGGIGTLQAYHYKAFKNVSAVLLGRVVYGFEGDLMSSALFSWIPFSDMLELSVFAEAGKGWFPSAGPSFRAAEHESTPLKYDGGVSFSISGDLIRVDLGHPVNEKNGQWRVTLRVLPKW
ncbi:hypothetical protein BMS3Abin05_01035 [bacterium BMS3Abin05]|nr:hypothetical protein BMS3Abin05_01035 [bacterium BMS3Abin05]